MNKNNNIPALNKLWNEIAMEIVNDTATDEHINQSIEEVIEPFLGTVDPELVECLAVVVREYQKLTAKHVLKITTLAHARHAH